jgi:DNA-binding NarL/FixJ family response regulator
MDSTVRVLLADDHPLVRAGIRATLVAEGDFTLVGEAATGDETQRMCAELEPDVLLLDVHMPGPPAVETMRFVRAQSPETKVLILTAYDSDAYVRSLISAGAVGYVLKEEATQVVVRAIRTVLLGDTWFSRAIVDKMARLGVGEQPAPGSLALTEREIQVLQLAAAGQTDRQIGQGLAISERTVRRHLQSIYCKFGVNTRVEAAAHAVEMGLVST